MNSTASLVDRAISNVTATVEHLQVHAEEDYDFEDYLHENVKTVISLTVLLLLVLFAWIAILIRHRRASRAAKRNPTDVERHGECGIEWGFASGTHRARHSGEFLKAPMLLDLPEHTSEFVNGAITPTEKSPLHAYRPQSKNPVVFYAGVDSKPRQDQPFNEKLMWGYGGSNV